jgi:hypothetical protein
MNGIFYRTLNEGITSFVLYRNGVYLYNSVSNCDTLKCHTDHIAKYSKRQTKGNYYDEKGDWGIYKQTSKKIIIERYWPIGFGSYGIQSMEGNILDSETIEITEFNGKNLKETWTYHFHPYSPKPDSTNQFIKGLE